MTPSERVKLELCFWAVVFFFAQLNKPMGRFDKFVAVASAVLFGYYAVKYVVCLFQERAA